MFDNRVMQYRYPQKDRNGTLFEFGQEYKKNSKKKINLHRVQLKDDTWEITDIPWESKLEKQLDTKNAVLDHYFYSDKGILYVWLTEYSMYPPTYYDDTEKYRAEYYPVEQYMFQINEAENSVSRMDLPELTVQAYLKQQAENSSQVRKDEILQNQFAVMATGNVFLASVDKAMSGLYDGETCERIGGEFDLVKELGYSAVAVGDDFFVLAGVNRESNKIEIKVFDQQGKKLYVIPTDIAFSQDKFMSGEQEQIMVGAGEDEILAATKEGIFRADFGEEKLEPVVDVKRDKTYYLSAEYQLCNDSTVIKGGEEDYYLEVKKAQDYEMDETYLCHYQRTAS